MATSNSPFFLVLSSCFLLLLVVARKGHSLERRRDGEEAKTHHYHLLQLSSLLPSSICSPSTKGNNKGGLLKVVHKHGPCSKFNKEMVKPLTIEETFTHDQARVDSIKSRLTIKPANNGPKDSKAALPAKSGSTIGSGNYFVTIGLGTPKKDLSLIFDTGSDLTWTQCEPCSRSCYSQKEPIFSPKVSTTYSNISCTADECTGLSSATGNDPGCSSTTCIYGIQYGDQSFSVGFFGKEKLTLTKNDVIDDFFFGCGQNNQGLFGGAAGLLGLGRDKLSIVSQSASKYGKVFSYCLPSRSSSTGYLTFGDTTPAASKTTYTPLSTAQGSSFYAIDILAIHVGGVKLAVSQTVFQTAGTIIDSGTVITRLPPAAYSALSKTFRAQMTKYPLTKALSLLDTCYDLSNATTVTLPIISFVFGGNAKVDLAAQGTLYANGVSQVCLAFAGNGDASDISIFGNVQQKTLGVVYDLPAGKLGFASGGCA